MTKSKHLSKQTVKWRRCFFLFMACFALSFTTNAQVSPFKEFFERYNNFNLEIRSTPYGQQFDNYGFENWEQVGSSWSFSGTKYHYEPVEWNSFKTSEGTFSGLASDQISESNEKRPGTTGSKSAKVFSKKVMGSSLILTTL